VLDIDSPVHDRFSDSDRLLIEALAAIYAKSCEASLST
jgi:putative methionine-R-sulfoxide reductase with GAF domain